MRGWVTAAFLSFFVVATALSQCNYQLQFSGEYRASILDISIDNNDLWAASGYGVQLYDRSVDPPRLVGSIGIPGITRVVRASNGVAYAGGTSGIAVVQHNGKSLQLVRMLPAGAINDLALQPTALFAATPTGIVEFDLVQRLSPVRTNATFPTTSTAVNSIAILGTNLYAVDGDSSVEVFSISVPQSPQKLSSIGTSLAIPSTISAAGSRLYVSDGQRTEIFAASSGAFSSAGVLPYGATSLADLGSNVIASAGNDRRVRIFDVSVPGNYVDLFEDELPPTAGNVNRVAAIDTAGGRLYVAAGDGGLATYDISHFTQPYPVRGYPSAAASSVVILPSAIYLGNATSGLQELKRSPSGAITVGRAWSPGSTEIVQDGTSDGFLLTSSGPTLKFWTVAAGPTLLSSATMRAAVRTAFLAGSTALALLVDGSLWTVDLSQTSPAPVRVAASLNSLAQVARSGSRTAATEITSKGTTLVHQWNGDVNAPPFDAEIDGVATSLATNGTATAVFTFRGITVLSGITQTVLPKSNTAIIQALDMTADRVFALTNTGVVRIWSLATGQLEKEVAVPGGAVALDAAQDSSVVAVATSSGLTLVNYGVSTSQPSLVARAATSTFYKKATASANRLYLFDGTRVDVYELASSAAPRWLSSIAAAGVVDIAASDTMLFTLTSNDIINEYSIAGALLRSAPLNEGNDVTPLSIRVVGGAPWVSFSRGCTTTGCEKRTDVLDPQSLVRTATLTGGIIDVTTNGNRAYAIFDLPVETRVYDISDSLHPAPLVSRATDVNAVAVAYNSGTVYLLADKAYGYSESSLTRTGEQLSTIAPATNSDLVIDNGCATIAGRSAVAETYSLPQWTASAGLATPGTIRTLALSGGRLVILTDYSIEIWSRVALGSASKRRTVVP